MAIELIAKIAPKNDGFTGMVDADQVIAEGTLPNGCVAESNVTQHEGSINHDALTGFDANEHIDHTAVSVIAGTLLTGGGTIAADRTLNVDESSIDHGSIAGLGDDDHPHYMTHSPGLFDYADPVAGAKKPWFHAAHDLILSRVNGWRVGGASGVYRLYYRTGYNTTETDITNDTGSTATGSDTVHSSWDTQVIPKNADVYVEFLSGAPDLISLRAQVYRLDI